WRAESEIRRWGVGGALAAVEPPVGVRISVRERNGQQVLGNLRVGEVLQVSSLIGSHDGTEVEPIDDFETDAFAFVHRGREGSGLTRIRPQKSVINCR